MIRQTKNQRRSPTVSVSSTTKELVDFMKTNFGGCVITLKPSKFKQAYHWQCSHDAALQCVQYIVPFLREPNKKRRATLLLSQYKLVTPRNGKYTDELNVLREEFERVFFEP